MLLSMGAGKNVVNAKRKELATMKQANAQLREEVKRAGVRWWQIADVLQIKPPALSTLLRHELSEQRTEEIRKAIRQVQESEVSA